MASEPISGVAVEAGVRKNEFAKPDCVTDPVCAWSDGVSVIRNVPDVIAGPPLNNCAVLETLALPGDVLPKVEDI